MRASPSEARPTIFPPTPSFATEIRGPPLGICRGRSGCIPISIEFLLPNGFGSAKRVGFQQQLRSGAVLLGGLVLVSLDRIDLKKTNPIPMSEFKSLFPPTSLLLKKTLACDLVLWLTTTP